MLAKKSEALTEAFLDFASQASNILHIKNPSDYEYSLKLIEFLIDRASDSDDDPLNYLIEIISKSIEEYESRQDDLIQFENEAKDIDPGISVLRTLIDQYDLTVSDFEEEIGSQSVVTKLLEGQGDLAKEHISGLSKRFGISPSLFF